MYASARKIPQSRGSRGILTPDILIKPLLDLSFKLDCPPALHESVIITSTRAFHSSKYKPIILYYQPNMSLNFVVSLTESTAFTATCPYCETEISVKFEFDLGSGPDQIESHVHRPISCCCPFCETPVILILKKLGCSTYSIEYVESAPWCRVRLTAPDGTLGKPSLSPRPSLLPQTLSSETSSTLIMLLKDNGYLTPQECSNIDGLAWTGNLYWNRSCPKCQSATQIKFAPIPAAVFSKPAITYTKMEIRDLKDFLLTIGRGRLDQSLPCLHCGTLLAIQLFPLEHCGLYMAKWEVDTSGCTFYFNKLVS
jgi:hypothetical protein